MHVAFRLLCRVNVMGGMVNSFRPDCDVGQAEAPVKQAVLASSSAARGGAVQPLQAPEARGMMSQAEIDAIHDFMTRRVRMPA